jgi:hypothetical protein
MTMSTIDSGKLVAMLETRLLALLKEHGFRGIQLGFCSDRSTGPQGTTQGMGFVR